MKISKENRKFLKLLFIIAPPVILQEVLSAAVNILDTIMIGRAMGVEEVAAVGLANQIFFLFILMVFGLVSSSMVFNGQYFGKGDIPSIHKVMGIGFVFNLLTALIFFVPAFFFPHVLIGIYSSDPVVIAFGAEYLRIVSFSYFFVAITFTRNAAMRSMRQTKIPMVITSVALGLNFGFNYLAIFVLETGLWGVAAGTLLARGIELVVQEGFIRYYRLPVKATLKGYFNIDKVFVKGFFAVSIFIIFNEVLWAFGNSIYHIAYGIVGTEAQGSIQISMAMVQLFQVFGNSIAISTSIIISNTLGASENKLAIAYSRKCIYFAAVASITMGGFLVAFSGPIVGFYNVEPHIRGYITNIILVAAATMVVRTINFTTVVGILRSGGDTKFCFYLETATVYLIGLPMAFLGAFMGMPIHIIFLMSQTEEVVKFFIALKRTLGNGWANTIV